MGLVLLILLLMMVSILMALIHRDSVVTLIGLHLSKRSPSKILKVVSLCNTPIKVIFI
jgi:hypothetical protein